MDDFNKASKNERNLLEQLFLLRGIKLYEFTDDAGYARYDAQITASTGNVMMIEAKVRNNDSNAYGYTTVIELSKVLWLLEKTKGTNIKPVCTFFFNDGTVYLQELDHETFYHGTWMLCPETTMGKTTKVWKKQVIIQVNKNKLIKLKL